jgi:SAM-dependent methyltransferase
VTRLPRLEGAAERMDRLDIDPAELASSLRQVAAVNRWLGGRRALFRHLARTLPPEPVAVLDVGTGSADLPRALRAARVRRGIAGDRLIAVDLHPGTLRVAARDAAGAGIRLCRCDALRLPFADGAFDFGLLSLTLHHFDGDAQVAVLRELGRVARRGVVVGELVRSWPALAGARLLAATVWRRNGITRHDGPVSVRRAFTAGELLEVARRAGLRDASVHRHPLFRLVLRASPAPGRPAAVARHGGEVRP